MSLCLRPVVETWGESLTYSSRETDIQDLLEAIAQEVAELADKPVTDPFETAINSYNDLTVFYVSDGNVFLDYLESTPVKTILHWLANADLLSADVEERQRQRGDIKDICKMAASWRKSIDPGDGSLRIYCD